MRCMTRVGFIATAIFLTFFTACGGNNNNKNDDNNAKVVDITITQTLTVRVGETKPLTVEMKNTDDFTVSVSPTSGSGCEKSGSNTVSCKPTAAGDYTVTVTASADPSKTSKATVTVPDLEIFDGVEQTLYADETECEEITFNSPDDWTASAVDDSTGEAPTWLELSNSVGSLAVNSASAASLQTNAVSPISGQAGNNSIRVTLLPNNSGADRSATITIATAIKKLMVRITQRIATETDEVALEKISVMYISPMEPGPTFILTIDNYGNMLRWDMIANSNEGGMQITEIVDGNTETQWLGIGNLWGVMSPGVIDIREEYAKSYEHEASELIDDTLWLKLKFGHDVDIVSFSLGVFFVNEEMFEGFLSQQENFSQLPNRTIMGRSCEVYTFTSVDPDKGVQEVTLALWNGVMMSLETDGIVSLEVQTITFDIPEDAFTRTMDITWID